MGNALGRLKGRISGILFTSCDFCCDSIVEEMGDANAGYGGFLVFIFYITLKRQKPKKFCQ